MPPIDREPPGSANVYFQAMSQCPFPPLSGHSESPLIGPTPRRACACASALCLSGFEPGFAADAVELVDQIVHVFAGRGAGLGQEALPSRTVSMEAPEDDRRSRNEDP